MEQILERISQLEKRVQMLEKRDTNNEINDFKVLQDGNIGKQR